MNIKSDFADEFTYKKNEYKKTEKMFENNVIYTCIDIIKDKNQFNKGKGRYISIDFKNILDEESKSSICKALIHSLNKIYKITNYLFII